MASGPDASSSNTGQTRGADTTNVCAKVAPEATLHFGIRAIAADLGTPVDPAVAPKLLSILYEASHEFENSMSAEDAANAGTSQEGGGSLRRTVVPTVVPTPSVVGSPLELVPVLVEKAGPTSTA